MDAHESFNLFFKSKRDQYLVEIRKSKNENQLQAKRRKLASGSSVSVRNEPQVQTNTHPADRRSPQNQMNDIAISFRNALDSGDFEFITEIAECIRRNVSQDEDPPLFELLNTNVVPVIFKLLDSEYFQHEKLMIECSWILTNIASGDIDLVHKLVDLGIIPKALNLFCHPCIDVRENAVWILANIAGENLDLRNQLLDNDVVDLIDYMFRQNAYEDTPVSFVQLISWFISLLLRGSPFPKCDRIYPLFKYLKYFLNKYEDPEVLKTTLWSILYLSDGDIEQINEVFQLGCNKRIIQLLASHDNQIKHTCLKIVGNLLTGLDVQTQALIDDGVIEALAVYLDSSKKIFRKIATWGLSNIMAGDHNQLDYVLNYKECAIINKLLYIIEHDAVQIAREAIICLTNACSSAVFEQVQKLIEFDVIELFVRKLQENDDAQVIKMCVEALECILSEYKQNKRLDEDEPNLAMRRLEQCGGLIAIDKLQYHSDNEVYSAVEKLIERQLEFE